MSAVTSDSRPGAYPRGRGGAERRSKRWSISLGLSPRTRGSRRQRRLCLAPHGPIPADAGEPSSAPLNPTNSWAYPRGRGGANVGNTLQALKDGLSPRTRGSRDGVVPRRIAHGPIPADAGEPAVTPLLDIQTGAYPRGRGGAASSCAAGICAAGLSPRTRGSLESLGPDFRGPGPIPADAGEPWPKRGHACIARAYPRGRGGARRSAAPAAARYGLSPRTRGSPVADQRGVGPCGPIPADAGEPSAKPLMSCWRRAYPRGRGGAAAMRTACALRMGLSPRTRGSRPGRLHRRGQQGPIPADAGEPSGCSAANWAARAYPRGRGGAPGRIHIIDRPHGLSPRTRGSLVARFERLGDRGPIPADAGEPRPPPPHARRPRAYPRGRGGAIGDRAVVMLHVGLSPRTRGSRRARAARGARPGPIPADAGEPGRCPARWSSARAYPRGRGGAVSYANEWRLHRGLSPRTRGSRRGDRRHARITGPIPADAGEPVLELAGECHCRAYPRGRGGAPRGRASPLRREGLSPRTRGSREQAGAGVEQLGPIPADAGEPGWRRCGAGF